MTTEHVNGYDKMVLLHSEETEKKLKSYRLEIMSEETGEWVFVNDYEDAPDIRERVIPLLDAYRANNTPARVLLFVETTTTTMQTFRSAA